MSLRAYRWSAVALVCMIVLLTWRWFLAYRQMATAAFIGSQCETTERMFIDQQLDPEALAQRLAFLMGYYEGCSDTLRGSPIAEITEQRYHQTLTNAVLAFRRWSTNDLGNDPRDWIEKYAH